VAHKLRSVLTLIGVVIGVTSVIAVVSLVNGATNTSPPLLMCALIESGSDVYPSLESGRPPIRRALRYE